MPADPPVRYLGARSARAHDVWSAPPGRADVVVLSALSRLYGGVVGAKRRAYQTGLIQAERVGVPVISIGNLVVGGTGKTPFTRWVAEHLSGRGLAPAILHGGYGLDEPELHRRWNPGVPVVVNRDRVSGARAAQAAGANVVLLDDGLQHLRLARDLDIVLVSADRWGEPQRMLPAGPWREPLESLTAGALVVVTHKAVPLEQAQEVAAAIRQRRPGLVVMTSHLQIDAVEPASQQQVAPGAGPVVAVCAIGDPLAFGRQLQQRGLLVDEVLAFDDHHEYTVDDAELIRVAAAGRMVLTTEKDTVKLARVAGALPLWVARQGVSLGAERAQLEGALSAVLP